MLFQKRIDGKGALLYQVFCFKLYTDVGQMSTFQGPNCSRSTFRRLMRLTSHFCLRVTVSINLPFWEVCILIPQVIVLASNTESIYSICFTYLYFYSNLKMYREVPVSFPILNQITTELLITGARNWTYHFLTPKPVLISLKQKSQILYQRWWVSHRSNFVNFIAPFPFGLVVLL